MLGLGSDSDGLRGVDVDDKSNFDLLAGIVTSFWLDTVQLCHRADGSGNQGGPAQKPASPHGGVDGVQVRLAT